MKTNKKSKTKNRNILSNMPLGQVRIMTRESGQLTVYNIDIEHMHITLPNLLISIIL